MPQGDTQMQGMMGEGSTPSDLGTMGKGDMGHPMMLTMMMAIMNTKGDGTLSLEEVQTVHARRFGMADADGNEQLSMNEIQGFMTGAG